MDKKIVNVGILTHFKANNFGANLQALSTASYLKKHGYIPIFINWSEYLNNSKNKTCQEQVNVHSNFIRNTYQLTKECRTESEIKDVIREYNIKNIIIGSDAVLTIKSFVQYFSITKKGIKIVKPQKDYVYPNPFWYSFYDNSELLKVFLMSPSSQGTAYKLLSLTQRKRMRNDLLRFEFVSARDQWTKNMITFLQPKLKHIKITPDPVFAFNINVDLQYKKDYILRKYCLPEKYFLVSFYPGHEPSEEWQDTLKVIALSRLVSCVALPMPQGTDLTRFDYRINLPLNPIDWYLLIKYSSGYIGNNMHPIIVSIHNSVPFFSIDNHGLKLFKYIYLTKASKTYELIREASLEANWINYKKLSSIKIEHIVDKLQKFNSTKSSNFNLLQQNRYFEMMDEIIKRFK